MAPAAGFSDTFRGAARSRFPWVIAGVIGLAYLVGFVRWPSPTGIPVNPFRDATEGAQGILDAALPLVLLIAGALAASRALDAAPAVRVRRVFHAFLAHWILTALVSVIAVAVLAVAARMTHARVQDPVAGVGWELAVLLLGGAAFLALGFALGAIGRTARGLPAAWAVGAWVVMRPVLDALAGNGLWRLREAQGALHAIPSWLTTLAWVTPMSPFRILLFQPALISAVRDGTGVPPAWSAMTALLRDETHAVTLAVLALLAWTAIGLGTAWWCAARARRHPAPPSP